MLPRPNNANPMPFQNSIIDATSFLTCVSLSHTVPGLKSCLSPCAHRPGLFSFAGVVLEQFLDEVDVGEDHAAAAVALETDGVEGVAEIESQQG